MVFPLDMPYCEVGCGNLHKTDPILLTATGCEPLTGAYSLRGCRSPDQRRQEKRVVGSAAFGFLHGRAAA